MNTTDHFTAAERLLRRSDEMEPEYARLAVAQAQVHAALAGIDEQRAVTRMMQTTAADMLSAAEFKEALSPAPKPDTPPEHVRPLDVTHSGVVIPWPPSEELVETVRDALPCRHWCASGYVGGGKCDCDEDRTRDARAVLDAIAEYAGGAS